MKQQLGMSFKFFFLAFLIGLFSVAFAKSVDLSFQLFLHISKILNYWLLLYVPCGFVAVTYVVNRFFPEASGSGMPQALAIEHVNNADKLKKMFYPRLIISKFIAIVMGTLFGATIGREGPTVQIGATILSYTQQRISLKQRKILLKIGASAGLAAAFNTPLGGMVFAMEELFRDTKLKLNLAQISAIAIAGLTSVIIIGNNSYFGRVSREVLYYDPLKVIPLAIIIGICSGLLAFLFSRCVHYTTISHTSKYNLWRMRNPLINAFICGGLIAAVGLFSHGLSFGNGYHESSKALAGSEHLPDLYVVYKMLGSLLSTSSGVPGGYFATSLSIGEGVGSLIQGIINVAPAEQYYILGMVAFLAAMTQAPITSITMVLQTTSSQVFLLPIMVAALVSTYIASLCDKGIYHYQIKKFTEHSSTK